MTEQASRIRQRAYQIWLEEGCPEGRALDHWEMARELIAIEDSQRSITKPNPAANDALPGSEPVESAKLTENLGEFPTLTDQGEGQPAPTPRSTSPRRGRPWRRK